MSQRCDAFVVQDLAGPSLARWFEVGPAPADREAAVARLRHLMLPDDMKRHFRSVALDSEDRVRAKVGGYITTNGRLTFWAVYHCDRETTDTRRTLTRLLIRSCIECAQKTPAVGFVETKPAFDTPDLEIFHSELRLAGLHEVAASHLFVCGMAGINEPDPPPLPGLERRPFCQSDFGSLVGLFEAAQAQTLDRAQRTNPASAQEVLQELQQWAGPSAATSLWSIAFLDGYPVGFALCGVSGSPTTGPREATLVELGVIPEARRKGIGAWLVCDLLWSLRGLGIESVEALVDDENIPSQRLHKRVGFTQESGPYWTWRGNVNLLSVG